MSDAAQWRPLLTRASRPTPARVGRLLVVLSVAALATLVATSPARGVLPPAFGGSVRLPLAATLDDVDPARQVNPSGAAVAAALFDTLYAIDARGDVVPVLAESLPTASVTPGAVPGTLTITLRSPLRRHDRQRLTARDVVASLERAAASPRAGWLLSAIARSADGTRELRATSPLQLDVRPARAGLDLARVLAARPLAIAVGDMSHRAVGTGPFSLRGTPGGATRETVLVQHDPAALGAAYLERVTLLPPRARDEELRAFDLDALDGSWFGATLYGARAPTARRALEAPALSPVLLAMSDSGPLRDAGLRGFVATAIDRRRLERAGLSADALLAGLPVAAPPTARPPTAQQLAAQQRTARPPTAQQPTAQQPAARLTLRLAVPSGDALLTRLAEAIAAMLDERGIAVQRVSAPPVDAPSAGSWDLRLLSVVPPLAGPAPLVGAALAATDHESAARELAQHLDDAAAAAAAARALDVLVLGRRRETLHYRDALRDVRFDPTTGALDLARLWLPRAVLPIAPAQPRTAAPSATTEQPRTAAPRGAR